LILMLSFWGCSQGYLYGLVGVSECHQNNYAMEMLCWYTPEFSPLWRNFLVGFTVERPARLAYIAWCVGSVGYFLARGVRSKQA
jgi:hypothetical protein